MASSKSLSSKHYKHHSTRTTKVLWLIIIIIREVMDDVSPDALGKEG